MVNQVLIVNAIHNIEHKIYFLSVPEVIRASAYRTLRLPIKSVDSFEEGVRLHLLRRVD